MAVEFDRQRGALWAVAGLLFVAVAFVAWRFVGTVVLGVFVYYVTRPVLDRLQSRLPGRTLAVVVAILAIALPVMVLVVWTLVLGVRQAADFVESEAFSDVQKFLDPYLDVSLIVSELERTVRSLVADPSAISTLDVQDTFGGVIDAVVASLGTLVNAGLHLFIVLVIAFYLLRDDYRIVRWARATFVEPGGVLDAYFVTVDRDLKNVYFGNILNAFVTGLLGALTYNVLNAFAPPAVAIPQPTLLGLLTGAASLVPVIGMKLVWIPVAAALFALSALEDPATLWFPVVFSLVSVVVVDTIPDQLLRPYVAGRTLHVGLVMLAYIFGPLVFGWYGIFLGPLILVLVVEFARIVFPWLVNPGRERDVVEPMLAPEFASGAGVAEVSERDSESEGDRAAEGETTEETGAATDREPDAPSDESRAERGEPSRHRGTDAEDAE